MSTPMGNGGEGGGKNRAMTPAALDVLARSALAGATPPDHSTIFYPLAAYRWPLESTVAKEDPLGATPEERDCVAWLMTISAHMSHDASCKAARQLAYAANLSRDAIRLDRIYESLATDALALGGGNGLVRIADIERALQVQWTDVIVPDNGLLRKMDPYYWALLESRVRSSVEEHVWALDAALSSLPGLVGGQKGEAVNAEVDGACRIIAQRLCPALLARDAPEGSLATLLDQLATELLPAAAAGAKRSMQDDLRGVRALALLAAAKPEELDERIQELDGSLAALVQSPPTQLVGQFADRGVGFEELNAAFPPAAHGIISTAVAPTSLGVRASILACWLQNFGQEVKAACAATTSMLHRASHRAVHLSVWSDVELRALTPGAAQALWPPVAHVIAPSVIARGGIDRVLAVERTEGGSLRVARLLCVLLQEVRMGLLPAGAVHNSVLAPIIARVRAEREVELCACIARELRPLAVQYDVAWPSGSGGTGPAGGCEAHAPAFVAAPVPALPVAAAGMAMEPSLLRDHAILNALFKCLVRRRSLPVAAVMLNEVVTTVRLTTSALASQTDASLVQAARYVCCKVVDRASARLAKIRCGGAITYQKARKRETGGRVGSIVAELGGVAVVIEFVQYCLEQMQNNSHQFSREWHPSRSARSRGRVYIGKRARVSGTGDA